MRGLVPAPLPEYQPGPRWEMGMRGVFWREGVHGADHSRSEVELAAPSGPAAGGQLWGAVVAGEAVQPWCQALALQEPLSAGDWGNEAHPAGSCGWAVIYGKCPQGLLLQLGFVGRLLLV